MLIYILTSSSFVASSFCMYIYIIYYHNHPPLSLYIMVMCECESVCECVHSKYVSIHHHSNLSHVSHFSLSPHNQRSFKIFKFFVSHTHCIERERERERFWVETFFFFILEDLVDLFVYIYIYSAFLSKIV